MSPGAGISNSNERNPIGFFLTNVIMRKAATGTRKMNPIARVEENGRCSAAGSATGCTMKTSAQMEQRPSQNVIPLAKAISRVMSSVERPNWESHDRSRCSGPSRGYPLKTTPPLRGPPQEGL